jgi:endonuclease YncB( thermonuclease family)
MLPGDKMKKILLIGLLILSLSFPVYAGSKTYGNITVEKIVSVYDGDTFRVNIKDWPAIIGDNISITIYGIDTPEK